MSRSRYVLPDPKCRHKRHGIVKAGDPKGVYAATNVCRRPECIIDAIEWVNATTHLSAEFVPDVPSDPALSLFG